MAKLPKDNKGYLVILRDYSRPTILSPNIIIRTIVPNERELNILLRAIESSEKFVIETVGVIDDFMRYSEVLKLLQGKDKPDNLNFGRLDENS